MPVYTDLCNFGYRCANFAVAYVYHATEWTRNVYLMCDVCIYRVVKKEDDFIAIVPLCGEAFPTGIPTPIQLRDAYRGGPYGYRSAGECQIAMHYFISWDVEC